MRRGVVVILLAAALLIIIAGVVLFEDRREGTSLSFTIRDSVSKNWVWDTTITLQNRTIRAFYQSDRGPRTMRFTGIRKGTSVLEVSAPGYEPRSIDLGIRRGTNAIEEPIELVGLEIPDLRYMLVFENRRGADIIAELRLVNSEGTAIINHPSINLWIGVRVSVQMDQDGVALGTSESGAYRGNELFRGQVPWEWDPAPETIFRYSAIIPGSEISAHNAPLYVIDYLIVFPKPRGDLIDIDSTVTSIWEQTESADLRKALDTYGKSFSYYIHTSWNVGAAK